MKTFDLFSNFVVKFFLNLFKVDLHVSQPHRNGTIFLIQNGDLRILRSLSETESNKFIALHFYRYLATSIFE